MKQRDKDAMRQDTRHKTQDTGCKETRHKRNKEEKPWR